jgi:hypothetical protein
MRTTLLIRANTFKVKLTFNYDHVLNVFTARTRYVTHVSPRTQTGLRLQLYIAVTGAQSDVVDFFPI